RRGFGRASRVAFPEKTSSEYHPTSAEPKATVREVAEPVVAAQSAIHMTMDGITKAPPREWARFERRQLRRPTRAAGCKFVPRVAVGPRGRTRKRGSLDRSRTRPPGKKKR